VLGHRGYEELVVRGHGETVAGLRMEDAPASQQRRWLDRDYPKSTSQAVLELRARGLDASAAVLGYLIKKGVIPNPEGEGRSRQWKTGGRMTGPQFRRIAERFSRRSATCL
jgi:hypothetical protein